MMILQILTLMQSQVPIIIIDKRKNGLSKTIKIVFRLIMIIAKKHKKSSNMQHIANYMQQLTLRVVFMLITVFLTFFIKLIKSHFLLCILSKNKQLY